MSVAVFNAGSSSLKFGLYDAKARELASGGLEWAGEGGRAELRVGKALAAPSVSTCEVTDMRGAIGCAIEALLQAAGGVARASIRAIGQRVVHGGTAFTESVRIDATVRAQIDRLAELAPLHNPPALEAIAAVEAELPSVPQVAAFDTAFFATLEAVHTVYPVPYRWHTEWGVRRFGFHGISHAYCATRAAELLPGRPNLRVVSCHLGSGCSATASCGGRAVTTTMGFTPLDGLMMGTRPGSLDPGIALHLQERHGMTAAELDHVLNHESGLKGVSGVSSDFRAVERAASEGNPRAQLALAMYALRIKQAIGALVVTLGGIDALVFAGGVGEHSPALRAASCTGLSCLGLQLDSEKNAAATADVDIASSSTTGPRIFVLHTREELMIARDVLRVLPDASDERR